VFQAGGGHRHEPLGQPDRRLVGQPAEHHVRHPAELVGDRRVEDLVPVPVHGGPPRRHPVDEFPAVGEREPDPARRDDRQRRAGRGHRPVRVPDVRAVEAEQVVPVPGRAGKVFGHAGKPRPPPMIGTTSWTLRRSWVGPHWYVHAAH
jgi:hypothetical protein